MILSETYSLIDAIFYDKGLAGDGNHNDNFYNTFDRTRLDDGTLLSYSGSGWKVCYFNTDTAGSKVFNKGICIEFDVIEVTGSIRIQVNDTAQYQYYIPVGTNYHLKIVVDNSNITVYQDDVQKDQKSTSSYISNLFSVQFATNTAGTVKYKDIKVYSI